MRLAARGGRLLTLAMITCAMSGCFNFEPTADYPDLLPLEGRIFYQGRPVPFGSVIFLSEKGHVAFASISPEGRFRLSTFHPDDGVVLGKHRVVILPTDVSMPDPKNPDKLADSGVPEVYSNFKTSPLKANVTPEVTAIEFDLR